jgi:sterol desaturase/sphingolipid hydroxylase (fatty acid hydroxylase superfamily)
MLNYLYSLDPRVMEIVSLIDPRILQFIAQVIRLSLWLAFIAAIFTPLERLFALHPKKIFRKAILTDIGYYFIGSILPSFMLSVPLAVVAWIVHSYVPAGFLAMIASWPMAVRLVVALFVGELGSYWGHRWTHEIPFLWRFHAVHHSAEEMDFLVSTRAHPVDLVFVRLCELVPLYMIGLASPMTQDGSVIPLLVIIIGNAWGFFIHSNVRWRFGPLEWIIATPAFHHWHHTNDGDAYINKNFAPMWPVLDKLFGTLYLPKDRQSETYGIHQHTSPILFNQLVDPFLIWRKQPTLPVHAAERPSPAAGPASAETKELESARR